MAKRLDARRRGSAGRRLAVPRGGPHPSRVRQPPLVPDDGGGQRARRPRPRVPRAVRGALEGARPAAALHERVGLAADRREPVSRQPGPPHPGVGRGPSLAREREASGDAHRLPRVRRRARRAGREPRDRAVVRVPEPRRAREVHGLPEGEELRRVRGLPEGRRHGDAGLGLPSRVRQAADAPLQGGDRVGPAHAGDGRLLPARPSRLPGAGHGSRRRPRRVLGLEGLRDASGVPALLRGDGAPRAARPAGVHDGGHPRRRPRGRALRRDAAHGAPVVAARRRAEPRRRSRHAAPARGARRRRHGPRAGEGPALAASPPRLATASSPRSPARRSRTTGTCGSTRATWTSPCPPA